MNRRDVMKTAAAIVALPSAVLTSVSQAIAERRDAWVASASPVPQPVYVYDSRSRDLRLYCADESTRSMQSYLYRD